MGGGNSTLGEGEQGSAVYALGGVLLEDVASDLRRVFAVGKHNAIGSMNNMASRIRVADGCTVDLWGGADLTPGWYAPNVYVLTGSATPTTTWYTTLVSGESTFRNNSITSLEVKCDRATFCNQLLSIPVLLAVVVYE